MKPWNFSRLRGFEASVTRILMSQRSQSPRIPKEVQSAASLKLTSRVL
ncbi:Protein of unknown function [Pyronema omphalodes CBS 100304]|uniref:Uncharacterized protein n=1 Tax=Pyronema omphalodes (strain CBS 100304) TaxID=1076935 RepID=U4LGN3_PYROM|nr:Protein of unknown function [Pyronema omphalodes CBS 100304]